MKLALAATLGILVGTARADSRVCAPDGADPRTQRIRAHLDAEARAASRWNLLWGVGFGTVAGVQAGFALAEWVPHKEFDHTTEVSLWLGAAKSTIGLLSHVVLPLKIPTVGPCDAVRERAESSLLEAGKNQRRSFLLSAAGGLVLNLGAATYLQLETDDWTETGVQFGLGIAISLAHTLTQPTRSWRHGVPEPATAWAPVVIPGERAMVGVAGRF